MRFEPASRRKGNAVRNDVPEGPILDEAESPGGALTRPAPRPHQLEVLGVGDRHQDRPELLRELDLRGADRPGPGVDEHPLTAADPRPRDEREGVARSSRVRPSSVLGSERCPSSRASSPA
jgi:hypothetical protein